MARYTLEELQDKEFFREVVKTSFKVHVENQYKGSSEIFTVLGINKVHPRHRIGLVQRNDLKSLLDIISVNPKIFKSEIISTTHFYYIGLASENLYHGYSEQTIIKPQLV